MKTLQKIAVGTLLVASLAPAFAFAATETAGTPVVTNQVTSVRKACLATAVQTKQASTATAKTARDATLATDLSTRNTANATAKATLTSAKASLVTARDNAITAAKANPDKVAG